MMARRHKTTVDLVEVRSQLENVRSLMVTLGSPRARLNDIDCAIRTINQLAESNNNA